jgi:hypothetical protein
MATARYSIINEDNALENSEITDPLCDMSENECLSGVVEIKDD